MRLLTILLSLILPSCTSPLKPAIPLVSKVELDRFMGDWYVIANIPTFIEKGAHNAVESYRLNPDGTIATTFTFRADSFVGPLKRHEPTGFVVDKTSNAVWGMQFIWPIKADYRITYLKPDYSQTIIAREARDYVWIMARTPEISEQDYQSHINFLASIGYETSKIQKVPQKWTNRVGQPAGGNQ